MIIWFTGLSGSGKTTLSSLLKKKLMVDGFTVEWYDGDRVREELKIESDFSKEGILKNNFEVINKINSVKYNFNYILISLISPYQEVRNYARKTFGREYFEVYVKCDINTLVKRDTKGLYKKAMSGKMDNLIGFSNKIPYEKPLNPELVIDTTLISPVAAIEKIYKALNL